MTLISDDVEKKTREIFHDIQIKQGNDSKIYDRLDSLISNEYFDVDENFFKNKICLDAGCGSNGSGIKSLLELGCKKVYAFDLDETILESIPKFLKTFKGKYELTTGNVLDIPFPDNHFDFVYCSGVLHHTVDLFKGLDELARVTKPGGTLYFAIFGSGGLFSKLTKTLRDEYSNNPDFKNLLDNLTVIQIKFFINWIFTQLKNHNDKITEQIKVEDILSLFDQDLILTLKDRITAPIYLETPFDDIKNWLLEHNFSNIERLSIYPKFDNVRKFLSPMYENFNSEYSKILFNEGFLQIKTTKL